VKAVPRIVAIDISFPRLDQERIVASQHGAMLTEVKCCSPEEVARAATGADVLLVQYAQITRDAIERLAPNAAIIRYGLGLDNIDLKAAYGKGVRVAYVPDYATGEVADHTVALILASCRKIVALDRSVRAGEWNALEVCHPMPSLSQTIVGFVGFGRIGREVHARLRPFGFTSIVFDPYADAAAIGALNARSVGLEALFSAAHIVTMHAPLTAATRHLVSTAQLAHMKPNAVIVNTARGGLIDTAALEDALAGKRIAGAALDVFDEEPLPLDSRLRQFPNVILTPHAAWYSAQSAERVQMLAADEIDRHLSGRPARCPAPVH
jgi:D-3-phosphoglycerate dehydrogenase / 2-oxoglutarate reductase